MIGDKSTLRRLQIQIPECDQPDFLAITFDVEVLRKALAIKESGLTQRAPDGWDSARFFWSFSEL